MGRSGFHIPAVPGKNLTGNMLLKIGSGETTLCKIDKTISRGAMLPITVSSSISHLNKVAAIESVAFSWVETSGWFT
jgi:hypothetical protein